MKETLTSMASSFNTTIDDKIFCSFLDTGIDPGIAWNSVYDNAQLDLTSFTPEPVTDTDDFEDVVFAELGAV